MDNLGNKKDKNISNLKIRNMTAMQNVNINHDLMKWGNTFRKFSRAAEDREQALKPVPISQRDPRDVEGIQDDGS